MRVLSCAGAYVSGAAGSNECPAGSVRIETEAACRTAVAAAGKPFSTVGSFAGYPRGCYYDTSDNIAYFNPHAVGAGIFGFQLLCAAITTGAPPPSPMRARFHSRVQRNCVFVSHVHVRDCAWHHGVHWVVWGTSRCGTHGVLTWVADAPASSEFHFCRGGSK
jgi:hypothetical protein